MEFAFINNFAQALASGISDTDTIITLDDGGDQLSNASADLVYTLTLFDSENIEIVYCSGVTANDLTVMRGQEGTTAKAWTTDASIELRLTAASMASLKGLSMPDGEAVVWGESASLTTSSPDECIIWGHYAEGDDTSNGDSGEMTVIGTYAISHGSSTVSLGTYAEANADESTAVGAYAVADGAMSIAYGYGPNAGGEESIAIGYGPDAAGDQCIVIDAWGGLEGTASVSIGTSRSGWGSKAVTIGYQSKLGFGSDCDWTVLIGSYTEVTSHAAVAVGAGAYAGAEAAVSVGSGAVCAVPSGLRMVGVPFLADAPDAHPRSGESTYAASPKALPIARRTAAKCVINTDDMDLTDGAATADLALPAGVLMFVDQIDIVITGAATPGGSPAIQIGTDALTPNNLLTANVTANAVGQRHSFTMPADAAGTATLHSAVTAAATGALTARAVFHGYVMEM